MKPLLLIDVGNTHLKWAVTGVRGAIRPGGRILTASVTPRWIAAFARKHAHRRTIVASVVPDVSRRLRRAFPAAVFVTGKLAGLPLAFHYPHPAEIGADRIAAAVAVRSQRAAIVVSCGTATAFSVVDRRGRFRGGAIAPGLASQLQALVGAAAQLPATTLPSRTPALGRSTRAAMRAGLIIGQEGAIREIVARLRHELGEPARVIITGGDAARFRGLPGLGRVEFRPLLVFEGLRIIAASLFGP